MKYRTQRLIGAEGANDESKPVASKELPSR
jgi:hypothetical protein